MSKSNRRCFLAQASAAATAVAVPSAARAQGKPLDRNANDAKNVKKVHWEGGSLLFLAGVGAHFEGDIKAHTKHVLDAIQKRLEEVGSSMEKVVKVNVYLNDLKDYAGMNEVFLGRFGPEPPVRTTIAAAGGIPGNSLVEIDCIAYI